MDKVVRFKKLSKNATTSLRGSPYSASLDLFSSAERKIIESCDRARIKTDIAVKLPPKISYSGIIWYEIVLLNQDLGYCIRRYL